MGKIAILLLLVILTTGFKNIAIDLDKIYTVRQHLLTIENDKRKSIIENISCYQSKIKIIKTDLYYTIETDSILLKFRIAKITFIDHPRFGRFEIRVFAAKSDNSSPFMIREVSQRGKTEISITPFPFSQISKVKEFYLTISEKPCK